MISVGCGLSTPPPILLRSSTSPITSYAKLPARTPFASGARSPPGTTTSWSAWSRHENSPDSPGGALLIGRQLVSLGLSIIWLLVITRVIGPAEDGPYVAALGICQYAQNLGQARIGVYPVRAADPVTERTYDVATILLLISAGGVAAGGQPGIDRAMDSDAGTGSIAGGTAAVRRILDHRRGRQRKAGAHTGFRRVAMIETAGQLLLLRRRAAAGVHRPRRLIVGFRLVHTAAFPVCEVPHRGASPSPAGPTRFTHLERASSHL
jgi:hypothetical protein